MSGRPRVSTIMPIFGAERTIARTLDSLLAQTEPGWEALLVDDRSTDASMTIARAYADRDARFRLVTRDANGGPAAARNTGIGLARGEWIHFLDPDDWIKPFAFESLLGAAEGANLPAAVGGWVCANEVGDVQEATRTMPGLGVIGLDELLGHDGLAIHAQILRSGALAGERFDESLGLIEDVDLFLRLAARGVRWACVPRVVAAYRLMPRQRGSARFAAKFATVRRVLGAAFERARAGLRATPGSRVDASPERLARELLRRGLHFASHIALDDPTPRKDLAAGVLTDLGVPLAGAVEPDLAAATAHGALPLAIRAGEAAWLDDARLIEAVAAWWVRIESEGWFAAPREPNDAASPRLSPVQNAAGALAVRIAGQLDVPAALASGLDSSRPIVLAGLGRNGVRVARALAARGVGFTIWDDALDHAEAARRLPEFSPGSIRLAGPDAAIGGVCLVSLSDDPAMLARVPARVEVRRWADAAAALSTPMRARLLDAIERARGAARLTTPRCASAPTPEFRVPDPARPVVDVFCASFKRPEKLAAMIRSVLDTAYPARVIVAAGDPGTIETCRRFADASLAGAPAVVSVWSEEVNARPGCTAPLNLAFRNAVRHHALFCTDDCVFAPDALHIAVGTLLERFPDADGVVGLAQENIPGAYDLAFPLFGRAFLDRFAALDASFTRAQGLGREGDLFWPGYFHLFNDAEIGLTIKCLGNWCFEPRARLRHFHPECGGGEMDATHHHGLSRWSEDARAWTSRRARGVLWGLDATQTVSA